MLNFHETALHLAVKSHNIEIIQLLSQSTIDKNIRDYILSYK